jgi:hypothetical protein
VGWRFLFLSFFLLVGWDGMGWAQRVLRDLVCLHACMYVGCMVKGIDGISILYSKSHSCSSLSIHRYTYIKSSK